MYGDDFIEKVSSEIQEIISQPELYKTIRDDVYKLSFNDDLSDSEVNEIINKLNDGIIVYNMLKSNHPFLHEFAGQLNNCNNEFRKNRFQLIFNHPKFAPYLNAPWYIDEHGYNVSTRLKKQTYDVDPIWPQLMPSDFNNIYVENLVLSYELFNIGRNLPQISKEDLKLILNHIFNNKDE